MDKQQYHGVYEGCSKTTSTQNAALTEIDKSDRPVDFDGKKLGLETHMYAMGNLPAIRMMVKRGTEDRTITQEAYGHLRGLRHPNLLPVENFYTKGYGWLIVPCIDGSLMGWMKSENRLSMFQGDGPKKDLAPQFRAMIILFNKLCQKDIFPRRFDISDCYIKTVSGVPKLQVLLTDVQKKTYLFEGSHVTEMLKNFIDTCCQTLCIELTDVAKTFTSYICESAKAYHVSSLNVSMHTFLESFPDNWTTNDKERYIFNIISGDHGIPWHAVRSRINNDGRIKWPANNDGVIVQELVDLNSLGPRWKKEAYPFDYIQQCRNCLKHFNDLPNANQIALGGSPQGLIRMMEQWDPAIWINLYDIYGPLVRK